MSKHGGSRNSFSGPAPLQAGPPDLPDKLYFRIGEVAALCRVPAYVLRFWQTEFPQLHPAKSGTNQRLYRRRDVETALEIKRLLHEEGYTIPGARAVLDAASAFPPQLRPGPHTQPPSSPNDSAAPDISARLQEIRAELRALLILLRHDAPSTP